MNQSRRKFVFLSVMTALSAIPGRLVHGLDPKRSDRFLPEERRAIEDYYRRINDKKKPKTKGLPPGLAKRGGDLPPGLQKKLERDGQLPPGLQKRMEPLPVDLDRRLPSFAGRMGEGGGRARCDLARSTHQPDPRCH